MASYVVMEPPVASGGDADRERAVLARDGFHLLAFVLPAAWFLYHRMWIEALAVIAVTVALSGLGSAIGLGNAAPALTFLVSLYVGLEGPALRLAALRRRGWREWGVVEAGNAAEAEIRYLHEVGEDEPPAPAFPHPAVTAPRGSAGPALGLFAYPGRG